MRKRIFVIDGNNLFCRGFFIAKNNGKPILAFILEMVMNIKKMSPEARLVFTFDTTKSERRLLLHPEYKGHRKSSMTEDEYKVFKDTLDAFIKITEATGCTVMHGNGYEADDYMACFARMLKPGYDIVIVSTDNDMYQLVNDNIRVYDPYKGIFISTENFFHAVGVELKHFLDFKCMIGDKSDNIPGFEQVKEISATKYINAYGSYPEIVEAIRKLHSETPEKNWRKKDVTVLDTALYNRNRSLMDLSINYTDGKLKLLIKYFVDNTNIDDKKLNTILAESNVSQFFVPMKGLRITDVQGNNGGTR